MEFQIKLEHIKLLGRYNWRWEDCEYGAPAVDCKRPFGNSSVAWDVAEILELSFDEDDGLPEEFENLARELCEEMVIVLQIISDTLKVPMPYQRFVRKCPYGGKWELAQ